MYLISIYFDENTTRTIQRYINKISEKSGNTYMIDGKVPPHITISAFEVNDENKVAELLDKKIRKLKSGILQWVSIGIFNSSVIFLAPVLNKYLHMLSSSIYDSISKVNGISISKYYLPLQWMPHTTIAKKLSYTQMMLAFKELNNSFNIFSGKVTKISLTKTNPYKVVNIWSLD